MASAAKTFHLGRFGTVLEFLTDCRECRGFRVFLYNDRNPWRLARMEEGQGGLGELGGGGQEDGAMAGIGDNPQGGARDSAVHVHRHFNGVEGVAVAVDDQGGGGAFGELRRSEVHVVVTVS